MKIIEFIRNLFTIEKVRKCYDTFDSADRRVSPFSLDNLYRAGQPPIVSREALPGVNDLRSDWPRRAAGTG